MHLRIPCTALKDPLAERRSVPADPAARLREEQSKNRRKALQFFRSDGPEKLFILKATLQPQIELIHQVLHDNEASWDLNALHASLNGENGRFRVAALHIAAQPEGRFYQLLVKMMDRLACAELWEHVTPTELSAATVTIMALRAAALAYESVIKRAQSFPYRLFGILHDPGDAEAILQCWRSTPCLLDPMSTSILERFPSVDELLSESCRLTLETIAIDIVGNTFNTERLHSKNARRAMQRSTHVVPIQELAVFHQGVASSPGVIEVMFGVLTLRFGGKLRVGGHFLGCKPLVLPDLPLKYPWHVVKIFQSALCPALPFSKSPFTVKEETS